MYHLPELQLNRIPCDEAAVLVTPTPCSLADRQFLAEAAGGLRPYTVSETESWIQAVRDGAPVFPLWFQDGENGVREVRIGQSVPADELIRLEIPEIQRYLAARCQALAVQCLPETDSGARSFASPLAEPIPPEIIRQEMAALPDDRILFEDGDYRVCLLRLDDAPHLMYELFRLREEVFRSVGEGTGRPIDTDAFDADYYHLILWHIPNGEIVGSYRLGDCAAMMAAHGGIQGLYTASLYDYTEEAGVRKLEKTLSKLLRKAVKKLALEPGKKVTATKQFILESLGAPISKDSAVSKTDTIGLVNGLAWTSVGGVTLPIEVVAYEGTGKITMTGSLGDVMKESATIALDYVRANSQRYGIADEIFQNNDIHIHVPEGAVPKDGPSAGVAIATAIISCLTHTPVDANVAMTGEVTLRGKALPIGGLREKSLAAARSGIKHIIVPIDNKKDVSELPAEVKEVLKISFMKSVDDALQIALVPSKA